MLSVYIYILTTKQEWERSEYIFIIDGLYMNFVRRKEKERSPNISSVLSVFLRIYLRENEREKSLYIFSVLTFSTSILFFITVEMWREICTFILSVLMITCILMNVKTRDRTDRKFCQDWESVHDYCIL